MKKIKLDVTQSTPVNLSFAQNQPISLPVKARGPRGLPSDLSTVMGAVAHGTDAEVERPDGYTVVTWIGQAEPVNSIDNDIWLKT
jgi:hypothetical protein